MDLKKCVNSALNALLECKERKIADLNNIEYCPCGYKVGNEPPKDGWMPYNPKIPLCGKDNHYWLRSSFKTPKAGKNEYFVLRAATGRESLEVATNPQGLLYLNGKMTQGLDTRHTDAFLEENTEYVVHNYFYVGTMELLISYDMSIFVVNDCVEKLYYDLNVPFECCELLWEGSDEYIRTMSVLVDAVRLIDFRNTTSDVFFDSVEKALSYLEENFYKKLCTTDGKPTVNCVGNTHIDVEWLWTRSQTREKIQRSFSTAKALMDRYPEYSFMLSQPEIYRYLKEEAPEKYEELMELVKAGRWEPEGAMYLEPDCNLTSGESLVRQLIHGKRFFREEFGIESKILFLPDVFGYSAALPQILKKSGVDYFVTAKIGWNDTNKMPCDTFMWEGLDGTEIFTSFITVQDYVRDENAKKRFTTYVGNINPLRVKGTWDRFGQKEYSDVTLMTYGYGDGGGGPTKEMLENQRRLCRGIPGMPVTKMTSLREHLDEHKKQFDDACARTSRVPRWVGELYLEYHRGPYTSIAKVKKNNRKSEFLLGNAESLSAIDAYFGGRPDSEKINKLWQKVLHNQFHDILPGSSVGGVYDNTDKDYKFIFEVGCEIIDEKISALAKRINTDGGIFLYNPTGFKRSADVIIDGKYYECAEVIPEYGWKVIKAEPTQSKVKISGLTAENDYYVLTLNERGQVASLYDKYAERGVFVEGEVGNLISVFYDNPTNFDAWEIEDYYKLNRRVIDSDVMVEPIYSGTRAGFEITHKYMNSVIKQTVWLYSAKRRIDFDTEIDWHEHHQIVKAEFPLDLHTTTATYDVQYGHVTRPTHENTSWDRAKFEVCAHKWVDMSENGYGVALLNDCKYGYGTERNKLTITLLKSATNPYTEADQGKQSFTYSLMPHEGDFREAGIIKEAFVLNQPLISLNVGEKCGVLPDEYSFVSVDKSNAVITAVKCAECGDGLVVRLYDAFDKRTKVTLTVPEDYKRVFICDLLENEEREIDMCAGKVEVPLMNFEIVTLKFKK